MTSLRERKRLLSANVNRDILVYEKVANLKGAEVEIHLLMRTGISNSLESINSRKLGVNNLTLYCL